MSLIHNLPLILFLWLPLTFLVTYLIAVFRGDVNAFFPYISDSGTYSPESCIFGQSLNMASCLLALLVFVRYKYVQDICERYVLDKDILKSNRNALRFGLIGCLGSSIVANFQETNMLEVHMFGAFLIFGLGTVWQIIQVGSKYTNQMRLVFCVVITISFIATSIFALLALGQFKGDNLVRWKKKDGGYNYHMISTVSEWILAMFTAMYALTFRTEFKQLSVEHFAIKYIKNEIIDNTVANELAVEYRQNIRERMAKNYNENRY